mmetsp:Transcript_3918/g.13442  ORF Transcript_3918/g.13442 Transcript_3918/m.13442 type:complete len:234 (-) Transcript_3918:214-915(-)
MRSRSAARASSQYASAMAYWPWWWRHWPRHSSARMASGCVGPRVVLIMSRASNMWEMASSCMAEPWRARESADMAVPTSLDTPPWAARKMATATLRLSLPSRQRSRSVSSTPLAMCALAPVGLRSRPSRLRMFTASSMYLMASLSSRWRHASASSRALVASAVWSRRLKSDCAWKARSSTCRARLWSPSRSSTTPRSSSMMRTWGLRSGGVPLHRYTSLFESTARCRLGRATA